MEEKIYPMTQEDVRDLLNKNKAKRILDFLSNCHRDKTRYTKLYKRWSKANSIVKYSSYVVLTSSETAGVIIALFTSAGILIPVAIGAAGLLETLISVIISDGFIKRRSDHYKHLRNKIEIFIGKFYHFTNKALSDGIVTADELSECDSLMKEYNHILNSGEEAIMTDNRNVQDQLKLITRQIQELKKLK